MRHLPSLSILLSAALVLGCGADSLTLPADGAPARVMIVDGDGQQGQAGNPLSDSLVISVTDAEDRPVVNRSVSFVPPPGAAVQPGAVTTNGEGKAVFRWVLGPAAGTQTLDVGLSGSGNGLSPRVTFTATAMPGPVSGISALSGDNQTAPAGMALPQPLVVRLLDSYGNGVAGEGVTWQASSGSLTPANSTTGPDGSASVTWTLGSGVGPQTATATFAGSGSVTFNATATQGPSPRLEIITQPSANAQSGVKLGRQPVIQLETASGSPIRQAGVAVTAAIASGGGSLTGATTVTTSSSGVATFTDLVITGAAGDRTLIFAAVGHLSATSNTIALAAAPANAGRSSVSASPAVIQAGGERSTVTVTVRDAGGAPLPGQQVIISVSGSGNSVTQPATVTDANGVATGSFSSSTAGTKTVSASVGTLTVTQTATVTVVPSGPSPVHTTASVPNGKRFNWTTIVITARDASGNRLATGGHAGLFHVSVAGTNTVSSLTVYDQGNGTYEASYFPLFKGNDDITITINGTPIQGSPFKSNVK